MQSDSADCERPSGVLKVPLFSVVVVRTPARNKKNLFSPCESWNGESWEKAHRRRPDLWQLWISAGRGPASWQR